MCQHIEEIYDHTTDKYLKLNQFGLDRDQFRTDDIVESYSKRNKDSNKIKSISELHSSEIFLLAFTR